MVENEKIENLFLEADKKYGKGSLKLGNQTPENIPIICSTGSFKLDLAIGCGGIPKGRIIEMFGPPSGGKTTLAIHCIKEAQKSQPEKYVAFIDVENSFDRSWATALGVNVDKLIFSQPDSGDEAFDLAEMMIKSGNVSLIVIDSVSAMATKAELEGDYGDAHIGQLARLMSMGLKKLNAVLTNSETSVIFINQIRMQIGGYGNPETTSGGQALLFYSSIRFEVRRGDVIGDKEEPVGFITKIKLVKNKVGPPFRKIETELFIGPEKYGISVEGEIADLAVINGIVKKAGTWYSYNEERIGQGRENFILWLKNNPSIYEEIVNQIKKTVLVNDAPVSGSFQDEVNKIKTEELKRRKEKTE